MKRVVVWMGAAVLLHSVASMAQVQRAEVQGSAQWRELSKGANGDLPARSPPGPHMILTVPVSLRDVPAEVDSYQITCGVTRLIDDNMLREWITRDLRFLDKRYNPLGGGVATGNLPASTGRTKSESMEVKVGIFLVAVGEEIEVRDSYGGTWRRIKAVDAPDLYQCVLYLFSQSWGSVRYLDPDADVAKKDHLPLPYQNGESAFPILVGAKYQRVVTGRFLPAK